MSEVFPPRVGGSGTWFWELYRRLPGERVLVAAGQHPAAADFDRAHTLSVHRLPLAMEAWGVRSVAGLRGYWRAARAVARLVVRHRVGELHCGRALPEGWIGWLLSHRYRLPYLCYVHGEDVQTAGMSREFRWMLHRILRRSRVIVVNSVATQAMLAQDWGIHPGRTALLHPGVETGRFVPAPHDAAMRQRLGWGDRPVVLTVGRLQKRKGHDRMIEALPAIRKAVPDVLYVIVGDGEERPAIEDQVARLGLGRHVQIRGEVDHEELVRCYQQCDLFVLPNRQIGRDFEGFGIVLLEAQACGKPVIAGASGGTAETMQADVTGLIVDCENAEPLGAVVTDLLIDLPRRQRMGAAARQWTLERFDWDRLARQAAGVFGISMPPDGVIA